MFKNRKLVISVVLIILFLLFFKVVDLFLNSSMYRSSSQREIAVTDSSRIEYDSLFKTIDFNLDKIIKEKNSNKITHDEIQKIKQTIKVSQPSSDPLQTWVTNSIPNDKGEITFYLVSNPGFISNKWGAVQYYLPGDGGKYYYEITLRKGVYSFQTTSEPRDSVTFAIDNDGVYKLGFQELHPNFIVFKDSLK